MSVNIRPAVCGDVPRITEIYASAVRFMRQTGNLDQWTGGYPGQAVIEADLAGGHLYVCEEDGEILAVFYYRFGDDPTYGVIKDGGWLSDGPYGVIHRIAVSDGARGRGVAAACFDFAYSSCGNVRIDTHRDNLPMQRSLEKNGFTKCGIIFIESGDERLAYQKC